MTTQQSAVPAVFQYHNAAVRVIKDKQGEPWWVAKDVCAVLGLAGSITMHMERLDDDEVRKTELTDGTGRLQPTYVVSESGLYTLIVRSNKPEARAFKRWITHELLPTLRRTGMVATSAALEDVRRETAVAVIDFQHSITRGNKSMLWIERLIRYRHMGLLQREAAVLLQCSVDTVQKYERLLKRSSLWDILIPKVRPHISWQSMDSLPLFSGREVL